MRLASISRAGIQASCCSSEFGVVTAHAFAASRRPFAPSEEQPGNLIFFERSPEKRMQRVYDCALTAFENHVARKLSFVFGK